MPQMMASDSSRGTKVDTSSCGIAGFLGSSSEYEEDQEGDGEAEEAGCLGQCEAKKRKGLHLPLGSRIARDRGDERREYIADADTGTHEGDAGEAGPDHFGGSEIHVTFRWLRVRRSASVQVNRLVEIETGQYREHVGLQYRHQEFKPHEQDVDRCRKQCQRYT